MKGIGSRLLVLLLFVLPSAAQTKYVVNDLGNLGGDFLTAQGINNAGQVTGYANVTAGGVNHAYRTGANRAANPATDDLGLLGGVSSSAYSINSTGQVGANERSASNVSYAVLVNADGSYLNLGDMGGFFPGSLANGINDLGQVTGAGGPSQGACGVSHAFLTAPNAALTAASDLGSLRLCGNSDGYAVNNHSEVAGKTDLISGLAVVSHAMYWSSATGMVELGVLGTTPAYPNFFGNSSTAYAINDAGQIVGISSFNNMPGEFYTHAFLTTRSGPMQDIGTLGGNGAAANGINNLGQVVGYASTAGDLASHAFVYDSTSGVMTDLNSVIVSPGWELLNAAHINDNGQITACGRLTASEPPFSCSHSLRLDPPGPAVSALVNLLSSPSLGLASGLASSLIDKLNNAYLSIQAGLNKQAINQLNAFISSVQTSLKNGKISPSAATTLTSMANAIIATLS